MTARLPALLTALTLILALLAAPAAPTAAQEPAEPANRTLDAGDRPATRAAPGDALGLVAPGLDVTARLDVPAPRSDLTRASCSPGGPPKPWTARS